MHLYAALVVCSGVAAMPSYSVQLNNQKPTRMSPHCAATPLLCCCCLHPTKTYCCLLLILPPCCRSSSLPQVDPAAPCCFSCGRPLKPKEAAAAKEQQGRCSSCQARHESGQHCGVCSAVWFDYEADRMATCSRCSGRVHEGCDAKAARAVAAAAAAEAASKVKPEPADEQQQDEQQQDEQQQDEQQQQLPPYSCPGCCRKLAEESRMDLLHLHAVLLADMRPAKPRAAAEIFAAEFARKVRHARVLLIVPWGWEAVRGLGGQLCWAVAGQSGM